MIISFVVLHYMAEQETIECVNSILSSNKYKKLHIIIVDNASTNDSFYNIKKIFQHNEKITLIQNEKNFGFSKGNNVGFNYAKQKLHSDFIILLNNDTVINQKNFIDVIINKYKEKEYSVLGPDIITRDGYHQNPLKHREWSVFKLRMFKLKAYLRIIDTHTFFLSSKVLSISKLLKKTKMVEEDIEDVRLHGACLIFSPSYVQKFDGLDSGLFLYMEEDLLQIYMDYYNLKMLYTKDLKVYHKEDVATNLISSNKKEKEIRFLKNLINSIDVCIDRLKYLENNSIISDEREMEK